VSIYCLTARGTSDEALLLYVESSGVATILEEIGTRATGDILSSYVSASLCEGELLFSETLLIFLVLVLVSILGCGMGS